jgi:anti-sigma regulatory factor (Ser/Thr protein kinase)
MSDGATWLHLPAEMSSLARFTEFAHEGARAAALPDSASFKLDLILEEILVNIFRYAYPSGVGEASVGYTVTAPNCLQIDICDRGRAFNPLERSAPDLDAPLDDRPIGGLGIFLVQNMASAVSYRREDGQNILSFEIRWGDLRPQTDKRPDT